MCIRDRREVYVEDSYENKVWEFYHEQTRDPILAYAVEIKGVEGDTVRGNLIELDYAAHVERMKKLTVPVETVAVTFKDDATFYPVSYTHLTFIPTDFGFVLSAWKSNADRL